MQSGFNDTQPGNLAVDFGDVQSRLQSYANAQDSVNSSTSAALASLVAIRPVLSNTSAQAPSSLIADLRAAASLFATTRAQVAAVQAAYATWHSSGRCSTNHAVCDYSNAASCATGSCLSGQRLCSTTFPTVTCTSDAACGGDTCLYIEADFISGRDQLNVYAAAPALSPPPPALSASLRSSQASTESVDLSSAQASVPTFKSSLQSLDAPGVLADLNSTRASLQPEALGIDSARADAADAQSKVQFDFSSLSSSSADLNATLADVDDLRSTVQQVDDGVDQLVVFLYEPSGLADTVRRLQADRLRAVAAQDGTSDMLRDVTRTLDDTLDTLNSIYANITAAGNDSSLLDTSLEQELEDTNSLDRVDAVTSDRYSRHGPYHFLAALQTPPDEPCSADAFVCAVDPETTPTEGGGVFRNKNGRLWDEDRRCITLSCINNQIDEWNKGPLTDSADFSELLPLAISRESATFLPYLIPLFMALVAALPLCIWKGAKWQRWPMCASTWCIAACTPIIFAVIGGLLFPLIIAGHDVCRGGANAAHTAASAYPEGFCVNVVGGSYNASTQLCEISALGDSNPVEVDVAGTIGAVLGDCSRFDSVLDQVYDSLRDTARDTPIDETDGFIADSQGSDGAVRPQLASDLRAGAGNASVVAVEFVSQLEAALGCTALNDRGVAPFKEAMCCGVMDSFYWLVASWYLIGFTMCLCGWPASLLGYKRLPNTLWGDEFEDVYEEELATQLQHASTVAKRRRRSSAASGWVTAAGAAAAAAALDDAEAGEGGAPAAESPLEEAAVAPKSKAMPLAAAPVGDDDEEAGGGGDDQHVNPVHEDDTPPHSAPRHQGGWTSAAMAPPSPVGSSGLHDGDAAADPSQRENTTHSDFRSTPAGDEREHVEAPLTGQGTAAGYDVRGLPAVADTVGRDDAQQQPQDSLGSPLQPEGGGDDDREHTDAFALDPAQGYSQGDESLLVGSSPSGPSTEVPVFTGGGGFVSSLPATGGDEAGAAVHSLADDDFGEAEDAATEESDLGFGFDSGGGGGAPITSWGGGGSDSLKPNNSSLPPLPTGGVTGSPSHR